MGVRRFQLCVLPDSFPSCAHLPLRPVSPNNDRDNSLAEHLYMFSLLYTSPTYPPLPSPPIAPQSPLQFLDAVHLSFQRLSCITPHPPSRYAETPSQAYTHTHAVAEERDRHAHGLEKRRYTVGQLCSPADTITPGSRERKRGGK